MGPGKNLRKSARSQLVIAYFLGARTFVLVAGELVACVVNGEWNSESGWMGKQLGEDGEYDDRGSIVGRMVSGEGAKVEGKATN
jgi:hypothetical protein